MKSREYTSKFSDLVPLLICGLSVPFSIFLWLGNVAFSKIAHASSEYEESTVIPPTRWLFSILIPLCLMTYALKRKGVNKSGAALGLVVAIALSLANYAFIACLIVFFFTSSRATKFRSHLKKKIEIDFKEGEGQRNWVQVLCNGGMATQLAILYLFDCGSGERPIDFGVQYRSSWLGVAVLSSFACCNGDTWASELGSVIGKSRPFLITTWRRVPRGTNGGVSIMGLIFSFCGGVLVGLAYFLTVIYTVDSNVLETSPSQWPLVLFGGFAGLYGSLVDSVLGATVQFSGIDKDGKIVEFPGKNIRHISGLRILNNHSVNMVSSIVTGVTMPMIAMTLWPVV